MGGGGRGAGGGWAPGRGGGEVVVERAPPPSSHPPDLSALGPLPPGVGALNPDGTVPRGFKWVLLKTPTPGRLLLAAVGASPEGNMAHPPLVPVGSVSVA